MIVVDGLEYEPQINGAVLVRNINNYKSKIEIPHIVDGMMVIAIGDRVFANNENLTEIGIPMTVTDIGRFAFSDCQNLKTVHEIVCPLSTNFRGLKIQKEAFQGCRNLEEILLSSWLQPVGERCFQQCHKLEKIGVSGENKIYGSISEGCFQACLCLPHLTIEAPTCLIHDNAFDWCACLKKVTFRSHMVMCESEDAWDTLKMLKIRCFPNSNLVDLGYEGVDIEIMEVD